MMIIGSFASYTKTKPVESAVWRLLTLDDGGEQVTVNRIKIPEQGQVQNCSFSFRTTIKQNSMRMKQIEQRMNTEPITTNTDE
jgi:hypothetical protein